MTDSNQQIEHDYNVLGDSQKTLLDTLTATLNQENADTVQERLLAGNWLAAERLLIKRREKDSSQNIVLVCLPWNNVTPFVTWAENPENLATYWGHYHRTLAAALEDFAKR